MSGVNFPIVFPWLVLTLLMFGLGVPAHTQTAHAQSSPGTDSDITLALEKAKLHLTQRMLLGLDSFTIGAFRLGRDGGNALPVVLVLLVCVGATGCCCPLAATPVTFTL